MNSPLLRWLLDLQTIPAESGELRLGWERPLPGWGWFLVLLAAVAIATWSYARLRGPLPLRAGLGVVRAALLLSLVALLAGPLLVMPRERVESDWVMVLVDRSASMQVEDVRSEDGRRLSRDGQLRGALRRGEEVIRELSIEHRVHWFGFDATTYSLLAAPEPEVDPPTPAGETPVSAAAPPELGAADGWRTRLGPAIEHVLRRAAGRPLAGIVVFSDGRTTDPPSRALMRRLQSEDVRVFVVPLGSDSDLGDIALGRPVAPQQAFVRDFVPVTVEVERIGRGAAERPATLRLIDTATGAELDRVEVPPGRDSATLTLSGRRDDAGEARWAIVLETGHEDLVPENNRREIAVGLVDRPLRVLYVDGYPRWEYRYLKNLLVREESVQSSVLLLSADRDFAQEGNTPLARLPRTAEELAPFDLFIIGDVPASIFSPEQLELMRYAVAERGAGLLWIAGPQSMPSEWSGTALADLLPIRPPLELTAVGEPVTMIATELADRQGVLQLELQPGGWMERGSSSLPRDQRGATADPEGASASWPSELSDPESGWSRLHWAQRIEPSKLKPTAEVLARSAQAPSGEPLALVVAMRYGAGQIVYVATDEIWRWRFGRGELLPEQFWLQILRLLGRERVAGADAAVVIDVQPRRVEAGKPVRVSLRLLDEALATLDLGSVSAEVQALPREAAESAAGPTTEIELRATGRPGEFAAVVLTEQGGAGAIGARRARVVDPTLPEAAGAAAQFEVVQPDEERRRPEADHPLLRSLAAESRGAVVAADDLRGLLELPKRHLRTEDPISERIWNSPAALLAVLLLCALEWIGRRVMRLL
jgi:hypothetical protein